ncbi:ComF family protein, partial [Enterococcus faecium]|uniref:ComF family protein n=1 Tax=Enterococcus faecium TaxID=1352 RepID=UPI003CFA3684
IYCPIPLSEKRWLERGFNQVSEMLKAAKIPFQMLLKREQHLLAQAKNTRKERLEMPQPFELAVPLSKIQHKKIMIIDDVYTTGQTLFHAAGCLQ